jgi:hypothetical protein
MDFPSGGIGRYVSRRDDDGTINKDDYSTFPRADALPFDEWAKCFADFRAAQHRVFKPADLEGHKLSEAFLDFVIRDPKVQACGKWLCAERREFRRLFEPLRSETGGILPPGSFPRLDENGSLLIRGYIWPVVLDLPKLLFDIARVAGFDSYQWPQSDALADEDSFFQCANTIVDAHKGFFAALSDLVAEGTSESLAPRIIPVRDLIRSTHCLDVQCGDLLEHGRPILRGIILRPLSLPATVDLAHDVPQARPRQRNRPDRMGALLVKKALQTEGIQDRGGMTLKEIARKIAPRIPEKMYASEKALEKAIARALPPAKP